MTGEYREERAQHPFWDEPRTRQELHSVEHVEAKMGTWFELGWVVLQHTILPSAINNMKRKSKGAGMISRLSERDEL